MADIDSDGKLQTDRFSVGLTGGIGSGKSTVADLFAARGATVIDTDQIAHQLTLPGGTAMPAIRTRFGDAFVTATGAMDRARMRELVFADPVAKKALEAILHPLIRSETERAAAHAHGAYLLLVVPLLIEAGNWAQRVGRVLVIDCPEQLQIERVMRRNGLTEPQVRAIMAAQATRETRLNAADDVIVNQGDTAALQPQVERLHALYCSFASTGGAKNLQDL
jgi:dephospho-CoA kinase